MVSLALNTIVVAFALYDTPVVRPEDNVSRLSINEPYLSYASLTVVAEGLSKTLYGILVSYNDPPPPLLTNIIESLNRTLRKAVKNRGHFPTENAVMKVLYLAIKGVSKKWTMPIRDWKSALNQFAIRFAERFPKEL